MLLRRLPAAAGAQQPAAPLGAELVPQGFFSIVVVVVVNY